MKVIAVNGSPRKKKNTATLLKKALEGAASAGAKTKLIHLYELDYQGCCSCFACKKKEGKYAGRCAMKDDLTDVLEEIMKSDVLILGSPMYLWDITGEMHSFFERLIFMNLSYEANGSTHFKGHLPTAFIYTMNISREQVETYNYTHVFNMNQQFLTRMFNVESEVMVSADTYQFDNYDKYAASKFDEAHKARVRDEQFPLDCQKAFELGIRLVSEAEKKSV